MQSDEFTEQELNVGRLLRNRQFIISGDDVHEAYATFNQMLGDGSLLATFTIDWIDSDDGDPQWYVEVGEATMDQICEAWPKFKAKRDRLAAELAARKEE